MIKRTDGVIVKIDRRYSWLEDPGRELPDGVKRLTGLSDADLAGQSIDEDVAAEEEDTGVEGALGKNASSRMGDMKEADGSSRYKKGVAKASSRIGHRRN